MQVSPADRGANLALAAALKSIGGAYERAATAARASNSEGYAAAGRSVEAGQRDLRRALDELERGGYSVA